MVGGSEAGVEARAGCLRTGAESSLSSERRGTANAGSSREKERGRAAGDDRLLAKPLGQATALPLPPPLLGEPGLVLFGLSGGVGGREVGEADRLLPGDPQARALPTVWISILCRRSRRDEGLPRPKGAGPSA